MKKAYTDGACSDNQSENNHGGWSWAIFNDDMDAVAQDSGGQLNTTNNIMEVTAIRKLLDTYPEDNLTIHTDSELCIKWISGEYKIKVKNERDMERANLLYSIINDIESRQENGIVTKFVKVKGHSGDKGNEYVDRLAVKQTKGV